MSTPRVLPGQLPTEFVIAGNSDDLFVSVKDIVPSIFSAGLYHSSRKIPCYREDSSRQAGSRINPTYSSVADVRALATILQTQVGTAAEREFLMGLDAHLAAAQPTAAVAALHPAHSRRTLPPAPVKVTSTTTEAQAAQEVQDAEAAKSNVAPPAADVARAQEAPAAAADLLASFDPIPQPEEEVHPFDLATQYVKSLEKRLLLAENIINQLNEALTGLVKSHNALATRVQIIDQAQGTKGYRSRASYPGFLTKAKITSVLLQFQSRIGTQVLIDDFVDAYARTIEKNYPELVKAEVCNSPDGGPGVTYHHYSSSMVRPAVLALMQSHRVQADGSVTFSKLLGSRLYHSINGDTIAGYQKWLDSGSDFHMELGAALVKAGG